MNFTREPIIETIITPKDGFKIVLRNTKIQTTSEYIVDAVEVVSFGSALFYRSLEKPKSFLVPITDYEINEQREARIVLKASTDEKLIKIAGGKEKQPDAVESIEKRKDRKRTRKKRSADIDEKVDEQSPEKSIQSNSVHSSRKDTATNVARGGDALDMSQSDVSSPISTSLLPPPISLISETLKPIEETAESVKQEIDSQGSDQPASAAFPAMNIATPPGLKLPSEKYTQSDDYQISRDSSQELSREDKVKRESLENVESGQSMPDVHEVWLTSEPSQKKRKRQGRKTTSSKAIAESSTAQSEPLNQSIDSDQLDPSLAQAITDPDEQSAIMESNDKANVEDASASQSTVAPSKTEIRISLPDAPSLVSDMLEKAKKWEESSASNLVHQANEKQDEEGSARKVTNASEEEPGKSE